MKSEKDESLTADEPYYAIDVLEQSIHKKINSAYLIDKKPSIVESPKKTDFDYGTNITGLIDSMTLEDIPVPEIAKEIVSRIEIFPGDDISNVESVGPFINFNLDMASFGSRVIDQVFQLGHDYGTEKVGNNERIMIDMSSPNIAKRMSIGHLRSTIIGDSLANLYRGAGYEVIRDNHIGDWGTQFGNLIAAIKKWGNEDELLSSPDPIGSLQELYVKFHSEEEKQSEALIKESLAKIYEEGPNSIPGLSEEIETISQEIMTRKKITREELDMGKVTLDALDRVVVSPLESEGRNWFLKLEQGDPEARRLWKISVDLSLKEFDQIYEILGVGFEKTMGESFYAGMLRDVVNTVAESGVGHISEGALVIDMNDKGLGVAMVEKSDGASLYMTRDLACAMYRQDVMGSDKAIYVVGEDQIQYFQQLFEALSRLGYKIGENSKHVYFGMVTLEDGKMSTRQGRVILLKDVLQAGFEKAEELLITKKSEFASGDIEAKNKLLRQIVVGALKWNDLAQDPKKSIVFKWEKALNFDGKSAPYVQYTAVRANSILEKSGISWEDLEKAEIDLRPDIYKEKSEKAIIRQLSEFPKVIKEAIDLSAPFKIAEYVYELSKRFNNFHGNVRVLDSEQNVDDIAISRLKLVAATYQTITNALSILGIEVPDKM